MSKPKVLITGASGLIGKSMVAHFLNQGWSVIAQVNGNGERLAEVSNQIEIIKSDLSIPGNGTALINQLDNLELVVNNAADQSVIQPTELRTEAIEAMFRVNLFAPLEIIAAARSKGVRTCINISSIEAHSARAGHEIYGASKAALESITKSLSVAFAPMRINGVRLGLVGEPSIESRWPDGVAAWRSAVPSKRYASPNEVAKFVHEISTDSFDYTTGAIFDFDGGKSASAGW